MRKAVLLTLVAAACASRPAAPDPAEARAPRDVVTPPEFPATASLWNQDPESLFGNRRAREVGDILTVIVEIDDEAEIGNEFDRTRSTEQRFGIGGLFGLPQATAGRLPGGASLDQAVDLSREQSQRGGGSLRREDRVTLRLAARVTERLPNGDLRIEGTQSVRVNYEQRVLRAEGIVRPEDISRANTVPHDRIADARIAYVGRGAIDRAVRPKIGDRVLDAVIPF